MLNNDLAGLDDHTRQLKHHRLILVRRVDGNVGISPGPKVSLVAPGQANVLAQHA